LNDFKVIPIPRKMLSQKKLKEEQKEVTAEEDDFVWVDDLDSNEATYEKIPPPNVRGCAIL
jgi:hypothetical protein